MIPRERIDEVIERNDIVGVISEYVELKKRGNGYVGLCPFHNEKTPSFSVSPERNTFHCFGCHEGGNVISFIMKYENLDFVSAVKFLARRVGLEIEEERGPYDSTYTKLREVHREAAIYFYKALRSPAGKEAYAYLSDRGLDKDTMYHFGLGYAPPGRKNLYAYLHGKGYTDEILKASGLFNEYENSGLVDRFFKRVMFPIYDKFGKVIAFGGRAMEEGGAKYLNSPETAIFHKKTVIYGLNLARRSKADYLILCEGYMDVITMHRFGFDMAVATLGTAFTPEHAAEIRKTTDRVYMLYDSDAAGQNATVKAAKILVAAGLSVKVISLAPYKDPDECLNQEGAQFVQDRIRDAVPEIYFRLDMILKGFDVRDPSQKLSFLRRAAAVLAEYPADYIRVAYQDIAGHYHFEVGMFRDALNLSAKQQDYREQLEQESRDEAYQASRREDPIAKAMLWWVSRDGVFEKIRDYIKKEDFPDGVLQTVFERLVQELEHYGSIDEGKFMARFPELETANLVSNILHCNDGLLEVSAAEYERGLNETLKKFRIGVLDRKLAGCTDLKEILQVTEEKKEVNRMEVRII